MVQVFTTICRPKDRSIKRNMRSLYIIFEYSLNIILSRRTLAIQNLKSDLIIITYVYVQKSLDISHVFRHSWGMETFSIPHPTPNAIPSKAQALVDRISTAFRALPDARKHGNNTKYSLFDAACSTFSVFFTQSPSFLALPGRDSALLRHPPRNPAYDSRYRARAVTKLWIPPEPAIHYERDGR